MGHDRRLSHSFARRRGFLASPLATVVALALAGCAGPAEAGPVLLQVQVVYRDSGRVMPYWRDHGQPVVAGRAGARYSLRLTNVTGERVLAVVAIDGVNVVTGETASPAQRGYVFEPGQAYDIAGWRKSDQEIAAFEFTALSDSYAARTGRPLDVGVIGVAVFREALPYPPPPPLPTPDVESRAGSLRRDEAAGMAAPAAKSAMNGAQPTPYAPRAAPAEAARAEGMADARTRAQSSERLGTGHGDRESSWVRRVDFERATASPEQVVRVRYDSWEHLVAAGVIPRRAPPPPPPGPRAFPADPGAGYVPDPWPSR